MSLDDVTPRARGPFDRRCGAVPSAAVCVCTQCRLDSHRHQADEGQRMFVIRDATREDLKNLQRLAQVLNTVNLPNDKAALESLLETSTRSFAGKIKEPFEREYLFIMED